MAKGSAGYRDTPFWKYTLAAIIIAIPALVLEQSGDKRFAWWYVAVITVMLLVYYDQPIARTVNFINSELRKR